tara:strand:+ start:9558 stop:10217 length:660 start_codon:yes stop_codon:yes gene_type:complete
MKINKISTYEFKEYNALGIQSEINFLKKDNLEVILHEELGEPIEDQDIQLINEFQPLLFSVDIDSAELLENEVLNIDCLTLLDGHHRYDFISRNNIDSSIKVIIVSSSAVNIDSHLSEIKIEKSKFVEFIESQNFFNNSNSKHYIKIGDDIYSSNKIIDIYELYDFKRQCFQNGFISPLANDRELTNKNIVSFTPIKLNEFYKENYLFPPKSTWITPRI